MTITNLTRYRNLSFEDYLKLPGTSFSGLKGNIPISEGMRLGTRVHQYIMEPDKYDWQDAEVVVKIATTLRTVLGDSLLYMEKELAFTCDMEYNGFILQYKGRADLLKVGRIVVDLKVLSGDIESACTRFGYIDQISGYCLANNCNKGLIISFNKLKKCTETKLIIPTEDFWNYQIVSRGKPVTYSQNCASTPNVGSGITER